MAMNLFTSPAPEDWSAAASWTDRLIEWGPAALAWILGLSFLFLLARAFGRSARYRATDVLDESAKQKLQAALADAETHTSGEIVVVVVERSDRHPAAHWVAAVMTLLMGSAACARWLPWDAPILFFGAQLAFAGSGMLAALFVPGFRRVFVTEERATEVAEEQAYQEFYRHGLHRTEGLTGVLLFVSLFEHRAVVLGDEGIDGRLDASHWETTDAAILDGVRRGDLAGGLEAAIGLCGAVLAEHFPAEGANHNQVENHVIVRAE